MGWLLATLITMATADAQELAEVPEPLPYDSTACPFGPVTSADATVSTVTINGTAYIVQTLPFRLGFEQALRNCGEGEAANYFYLWRQRRRWSNICLVIFPATAGVSLIPAAWFALKGTAFREGMLVALEPDQVM